MLVLLGVEEPGLVVSGEVLLGAVLEGMLELELGAVELGELAGGMVSISELLLRVVSRLQPVKPSAASARAEAERRAMRLDFMGHLSFLEDCGPRVGGPVVWVRRHRTAATHPDRRDPA